MVIEVVDKKIFDNTKRRDSIFQECLYYKDKLSSGGMEGDLIMPRRDAVYIAYLLDLMKDLIKRYE